MMRPAQWMVFVWVTLVSFADLVRSNLDSYEQDDICSFIRKKHQPTLQALSLRMEEQDEQLAQVKEDNIVLRSQVRLNT